MTRKNFKSGNSKYWSDLAKYTSSSSPNVNDDIDLGYEVGDFWLDTNGKNWYSCVDNTDGNAIWKNLSIDTHNNLNSLQGGTTNEYYHLTSAQNTNVANWSSFGIGVSYGGTGTTTQFTSGSVVFAGINGVYSQDNSNLFWDDSNNRLGIGTASPSQPLHIYNTASKTIQFLINSTASGNYETQIESYCKDSKWRIYNKSSTNSLNPGRFGFYDVYNSEVLNAYLGGSNGYCLFAKAVVIGVIEDLVTSDIKQKNGLQLRYSSTSGSEFGFLCARDSLYMSSNAYYDGTWKYIGSDKSSRLTLSDTGTLIYNATNTSGSSGGTITFTEIFRVLPTGSFGIGTSAPDKKLEINTGAATDGIRISYNDANGTASTYADMLLNSSGDLSITATGGDISFDNENLTTTGTVTGNTLVSSVATGTAPLTVSSATVVSNLNADLLDGNHATAFTFSNGLAGGQSIIGGIASGDDLTLSSSSDATKGTIFFGSAKTSGFDEVNGRLGIGTDAPTYPMHAYLANNNSYIAVESGGAYKAGIRFRRLISGSDNLEYGAWVDDNTNSMVFYKTEDDVNGNIGTVMTITRGSSSGGLVAIGLGSDVIPTSNLTVNGTIENQSIYSGSDAGTALYCGTIGGVANRYYKYTSSRRFKQDITDIEIDTSKIHKLRASSFSPIGKPEIRTFGLIAEEVVEIIPELVPLDVDGHPESVNYALLSVILLEEMKKLKNKIEKLEVKS